MSVSWKKIDFAKAQSGEARYVSSRYCPICDADDFTVINQMKAFQFYTDDVINKQVDITNVQCQSCEALYMNPGYSPVGFDVLFREAGCSYGMTDGRTKEQLDWLKTRGLLQDQKTFLDVGCGDGALMKCLPDGIRCIGVDIDLFSIEKARKNNSHHNVEFICADFDAFKPDFEPDLISLFHVLEHLPNPIGTLRHLRSISKKGSHLIVEVPVMENGFTNDIMSFFSPQHMTHFSGQSFMQCVKNAGWSIVEAFQQPDYNGTRILAVNDGSGSIQKDFAPKPLDHLLQLTQSNNRKIEATMNKLLSSNKVIVWGAGNHIEKIFQVTNYFNNSNSEFIIVDSDKIKQKQTWRGINIYSPDVLGDLKWQRIPVLISSYGSQPIIQTVLNDMGWEPDHIITLYDHVHVY